jgi:putative flippase GtrA
VIDLVRRLLNDERIRFLIVGGVNTLVGYGLFALIQFLFGQRIGYLGSLYSSYLIATVLAFTLHRRFTFRAHESGRLMLDFVRFAAVNVVSLLLNTGLLALLVELAHWNAYLAQAASVVVTTVVSYVGHKWFSFHRARDASGVDEPVDQS